MDLFKEEVYERMEECLRRPSACNGMEEALRKINHDKRLQDFIKEYAVKNAISKRYPGLYGYGNVEEKTFKEVNIPLWRKSGESPLRMYIGPDPSKNVAPIFMAYTHEARDSDGDPFTAIDYLEVIESEDCFYLKGQGIYNNKRIGEMGYFTKVRKEKILSGLEKAINKLVNQ
jgi:hypothetical protein